MHTYNIAIYHVIQIIKTKTFSQIMKHSRTIFLKFKMARKVFSVGVNEKYIIYIDVRIFYMVH